MDPHSIPANILRCMKIEDRKALKVQTPEEFVTLKADKAEKALQKQCEGWLRYHDIEFLHLSFRARERIGWPDLVFANPFDNGRMYAVELKSAQGKLTEEQRNCLDRLGRNGAKTLLIRSLDEFIAEARNDGR